MEATQTNLEAKQRYIASQFFANSINEITFTDYQNVINDIIENLNENIYQLESVVDIMDCEKANKYEEEIIKIINEKCSENQTKLEEKKKLLECMIKIKKIIDNMFNEKNKYTTFSNCIKKDCKELFTEDELIGMTELISSYRKINSKFHSKTTTNFSYSNIEEIFKDRGIIHIKDYKINEICSKFAIQLGLKEKKSCILTNPFKTLSLLLANKEAVVRINEDELKCIYSATELLISEYINTPNQKVNKI